MDKELENFAQKTNDRIAAGAIYHELIDIIPFISWKAIKDEYFPEKSVAWIYDRISGKDKDNNLVEFTPSEIIQLKNALKDVSVRINKVADFIH